MTEHLTPADLAIAVFGSPEAVARVCDLSTTVIFNWRRPATHRDAGDIPSARHMRALLTEAERRGLPLRAEHLIRGLPRAEAAALFAPQDAAA